jgi:putative glutamine amidotransferase
MRPIIGMLASLAENGTMMAITRDYLNSIWNSGGMGVVLPYTNDPQRIKEYVAECDGFVFCGGVDIDPKYYGQENNGLSENICSERDEFESLMFTELYPTGKPILGICRGEQVINVFLGGTLIQHIDGHRQSEERHVLTHEVVLNKDGELFDIIGRERIMTNSFHHQIVDALAEGLVCDAINVEGYIEAYHSSNHPFLLCVQWHPENFFFDETSSKIFKAFLNACNDKSRS